MQANFQSKWRWAGLILWAAGLFCVFYFHLYRYMSVDSLERCYASWECTVSQHYLISVIAFIGICTVLVALALPVAPFVAMAGGMLFGFWGLFYVLFSMTTGASITYWLVRNLMSDWFVQKLSGRLAVMEKQFEENAFYYLLSLRVLPVVPFSVVSIAAGVLNVRFKIFLLATIFGMIPIKVFYLLVGRGLVHWY